MTCAQVIAAPPAPVADRVCAEDGCGEKANVRYRWPGKTSDSHACFEHAWKVEALGRAIGVEVEFFVFFMPMAARPKQRLVIARKGAGE